MSSQEGCYLTQEDCYLRPNSTRQFDWASLSKPTFSLSFEDSVRLTNAGIDISTFGMGLALGSVFSLPDDAQSELQTSLDQIAGEPSFSDTLWVWFRPQP